MSKACETPCLFPSFSQFDHSSFFSHLRSVPMLCILCLLSPFSQLPLLLCMQISSITQTMSPAMGGYDQSGCYAGPPPNQQHYGLYPQPGQGMPQAGPGMGYPGGPPPGQQMPGYPGAPGLNPSMPGGYPRAPSPNPSMPVYPKVPSPNPSMPGYGGGAPIAPAVKVST